MSLRSRLINDGRFDGSLECEHRGCSETSEWFVPGRDGPRRVCDEHAREACETAAAVVNIAEKRLARGDNAEQVLEFLTHAAGWLVTSEQKGA